MSAIPRSSGAPVHVGTGEQGQTCRISGHGGPRSCGTNVEKLRSLTWAIRELATALALSPTEIVQCAEVAANQIEEARSA